MRPCVLVLCVFSLQSVVTGNRIYIYILPFLVVSKSVSAIQPKDIAIKRENQTSFLCKKSVLSAVLI